MDTDVIEYALIQDFDKFKGNFKETQTHFENFWKTLEIDQIEGQEKVFFHKPLVIEDNLS